MRFLVDAHLPRRLVYRLREAGQDAVRTLDLPKRNRTTDEEINELAEREQRVIMTKDADFVTSFLQFRKPRKLLLVSTGNISNEELEALFVPNLPVLVAAMETHEYVELTRTSLIIHV